MKIAELNVRPRTRDSLARAGIYETETLLKYWSAPALLHSVPSFGRVSLGDLMEALDEAGLPQPVPYEFVICPHCGGQVAPWGTRSRMGKA